MNCLSLRSTLHSSSLASLECDDNEPLPASRLLSIATNYTIESPIGSRPTSRCTQYTDDSSNSSAFSRARSTSVSTTGTSIASSPPRNRRRKGSFIATQLIPLFNNGMPIQLPQRRLSRKQSVKDRPKRPTVSTNVGNSLSALGPHVGSVTASATSTLGPQLSRVGVGIRPVVSETLLTQVTPAGNIGKLDGNSTACEIELSSDCQKKA
jgi:hypothetical protein